MCLHMFWLHHSSTVGPDGILSLLSWLTHITEHYLTSGRGASHCGCFPILPPPHPETTVHYKPLHRCGQNYGPRANCGPLPVFKWPAVNFRKNKPEHSSNKLHYISYLHRCWSHYMRVKSNPLFYFYY